MPADGLHRDELADVRHLFQRDVVEPGGAGRGAVQAEVEADPVLRRRRDEERLDLSEGARRAGRRRVVRERKRGHRQRRGDRRRVAARRIGRRPSPSSRTPRAGRRARPRAGPRPRRRRSTPGVGAERRRLAPPSCATSASRTTEDSAPSGRVDAPRSGEGARALLEASVRDGRRRGGGRRSGSQESQKTAGQKLRESHRSNVHDSSPEGPGRVIVPSPAQPGTRWPFSPNDRSPPGLSCKPTHVFRT